MMQSRPARLGYRFWLSLSTPGLLLGTLFFAISLSPSLVPRPFTLQVGIAGIALALGYGLGVFLTWLWRFMELPQAHGRPRRWLKLGFGLLSLGVAIGFVARTAAWQNDVRLIMGLPPLETGRPISTALLALLIFALLLGTARGIRWIKRQIVGQSRRIMPHRVALVFGATVTLIIVWSLASGVLARLALNSFDASFQQLDMVIESEQGPPAAPWATGSAESLIDWESLGRQGRRFISLTPSPDDIARFAPGAIEQPLRVYVGLNSAEEIRERAELALAELLRIGAFERELLVIVTPTGTGWVDPGAIRSLEHLHGGRVASVAVQYSYLPSWLSLLAQPEFGAETSAALFEVVYEHWRRLPSDQRPRLFLHGLSLGALNSERSADLWDMVADPIDGALWSGPPFRSETWQWVTARRQADSPAWLPRFRDGSVIRFANQHGGLEEFETEWGPFRIAYLQYASDPITFFEPTAFYREPAWMREPRGPDVADRLRWYPMVTFLQLAADIAAADNAPVGYGHTYATEHYLDTWYHLTEPAGWDEARLARLREAIGDLNPAED
ncbi:MAG: alpha/beta hydrolase [Wenzhouxiangella sp.]